MKFVKVTLDNNIDLLEKFVAKVKFNIKTFRYFNSRPISAIKSHLITLLLIDNEKPVAYGHLDSEQGTIWLGLCVLPEYQGIGYGTVMMKALFKEAKKLNLSSIYLTVDKDNLGAIRLYEKAGFFKIEKEASHYKLKWDSTR